jgi:formamidopyrimidine-DNA glycosylase
MDPSVIAGIGNIYSDEILWRASVHPMSLAGKIPEKHLKEMFKAMKQTLEKGIELGGDSNVDYRNIDGERGSFQEHHRAYQQTKKKCQKKGCGGVIERMVVGARSAHFCPKHQILFK